MKRYELIIRVLVGTAAAAGLYLISRDNYLLFHVLAEMFSIVVAWAVFIVFWNTRKIGENTYFLFIGIAFLFVGLIDLVHMLAYEGMRVLPGFGANTATQLWITARSIQAVSLFIAPFYIGRKIRARIVFLSYFAVVTLVLSSIFIWGIFPVCFVDGVGLTPFKKVAEYVICLFFSASIFLLARRRALFDTSVFSLLSISVGLAVVSEVLFTLYTSPYGFSNMLGHLLKIASFYFMYKAVVQTTLIEPYAVLFHNLKQNEETQRVLLNATKNRAVLLSTDGKIAALNDNAAMDFKRSSADLIGKDIYSLLAPGLARSMKDRTEIALRSREPVRFEEEVSGRWFDIRVHPVIDSDGTVVRWAIYNEEITERKQLESELIRLSITDNLTGLFNQRHFTKKIKEEVERARRMRYPLCLVIFDVDNFKTYNDLHGHLKGDQILRAIGEITLRSIRNEVDSGYRYGGDEFALILPYSDPVIAENIIKRINMKVTEKTHGVTISYGISWLVDDISIEELITSADKEMYGKKSTAKQGKIAGLEGKSL